MAEGGELRKSLPVFDTPHCLIRNDGNGLFIDKSVNEQLSQIEEVVNVIAITGPARTGKSFLMNRLAKSQTGFPLGNTIHSKTKGIWVWCLNHPIHKDQVMVLLDTEGIGDALKQDDSNDNKILCLAALLCSTFVYNMKGVFNRDTLDKLCFITRFGSKVIVSKDKQKDALTSDISFFLPKFVLCLRDFSHDLCQMEPDDYLKSVLALDPEGDPKYNEIRKCIHAFFPNIKCCIFDPPATGRKQLARLDTLEETDLSECFLRDTKVFIDVVYACKPKQLLDGKMLNGRMLSSLVKTYVDMIRTDGVPCIDDAFTIMAKQENQAAVVRAVEVFKEHMDLIQIPISKIGDFEKSCKRAKIVAMKKYREMSVLDAEQEFCKMAEKKMDDIRDQILEESNQRKRKEYESILQSKYDSEIKPKVQSGRYDSDTGYKTFKDDVSAMIVQAREGIDNVDDNMLKGCILEFRDRYEEHEALLYNIAEKTKIDKEVAAEKEKRVVEMERDTQNLKLHVEAWKKEMKSKENVREEEVGRKLGQILKGKEEGFVDERRIYQKEIAKLRKEREANKLTAGKFAARVVSSLFPVVGPIVYSTYEYKSHNNVSESDEEVSAYKFD
ncbi:guanylate-binding protein 1-like [Mercenaria mercenaria]|uniref:guanylate-binding protein 1-like n=1 Tax=Mercenaria mercenaria TaxID=6596 RepID=UPI001E1D5F98|nr:guanylate-binding protein 1-like [Mercenaria mercenaria]